MGFFGKLVVFILFLAVLAIGGWGAWEKYTHEREIANLQNALAQSAQTIKIQEGQFQKLMEVQKDMQHTIDETTKQGADLAKRLEKLHATLLVVSNAQIDVQDQLIEVKDAVNTKRPEGNWEFKVSQKKGILGVDGTCFSGPTAEDKSGCQFLLKIDPFTVTQVVSQQPDGSWKIDAALPPGVDIRFDKVSVNPYILKPRWYEKFNLSLQGAVTPGIQEGLVGFGLGYKVSNYNISGLTLFSTAGSNHGYVGLGITWFPWEK